MVVRLRRDYIWGDARRFLGKQVSRLSVSAMILLTAFLASLEMTIRESLRPPGLLVSRGS